MRNSNAAARVCSTTRVFLDTVVRRRKLLGTSLLLRVVACTWSAFRPDKRRLDPRDRKGYTLYVLAEPHVGVEMNSMLDIIDICAIKTERSLWSIDTRGVRA